MPIVIHAVVGQGADTPASVVQDGLREVIKKGDEVAVGWYGPPKPAMKHVYDYLLREEVPFTLFFPNGTTAPPKVFSERDGVTVAPALNVTTALAQSTTLGGKGLILGASDEEVLAYFDRSPDEVTLWELDNGLVPIDITDGPMEEEAPAAPAPVKEEPLPSLEGFTREDLMGLSFKVLKRAASEHSDEVPATAADAVNIILGEVPEEAVSSAIVVEEEEPEADPVVSRVVKEDEIGKHLTAAVNLLRDLIPNREVALAITKVQEAQMWFEYGAHV